MNRRVIPLPKHDARNWLIENGIDASDKLTESLAKELKRFFDIGADN